MKTRKIPPQLKTYPKELYAVLSWAHKELTDNVVQIKNITIGKDLTKAQANRLRFRLNQLGRSLEFWAPNAEISQQSENLMFFMRLTDRTKDDELWNVNASLRSSESLLDCNTLPGFDKILKELEIPKAEILPEVVEGDAEEEKDVITTDHNYEYLTKALALTNTKTEEGKTDD